MQALRQSARSMYAYACFDLECLCRELTEDGLSRDDARQALSARAEELAGKISHNLRGEVLATENPADPAVVVVAEDFAKRVAALCRDLLNHLLGTL